MDFEDAIDIEKKAYDNGYLDGVNKNTPPEQIHLDAANTGIVRGLKEGYTIGYNLGFALIESFKDKIKVVNNNPSLTNRRNKIYQQLIECTSQLKSITLNDDSYNDVLGKNFELVRRIEAITSKNGGNISKVRNKNNTLEF